VIVLRLIKEFGINGRGKKKMNKYDLIGYAPLALILSIWVTFLIINEDFSTFIYLLLGLVIFLIFWEWIGYWTKKSIDSNRELEEDYYY